MQTYRYVGPRAIAERAMGTAPGAVMTSQAALVAWLNAAGVTRGRLTATYVVDLDGRLRLADRRSEHIACAGGGEVLAAGEITLNLQAGQVEVEEVTNQSTGYCPEPESWPAVAAALTRAQIGAPDDYTTKFQFRRCPSCDQTNVVKDELWACAVCGHALPLHWNFDPA